MGFEKNVLIKLNTNAVFFNTKFVLKKTGDAPPEGAIGVSNRAAALSTWY